MLALTLTIIYYDAGFLRKIVPKKIKQWVSRAYRKQIIDHDQTLAASHSQTRPLFLVFLGIYILIQLLVPFRHLTYPGWTTWHEDGHDFAWRMMLKQKTARNAIQCNPPSNRRTAVCGP